MSDISRRRLLGGGALVAGSAAIPKYRGDTDGDLVFDVSDDICHTRPAREWAKREGLTDAFRVEVDTATLKATVHEFVRSADGKFEHRGEFFTRRTRTAQLKSLP